ncbi:hypothetical protein V1503_18810 [Bacillus sp. SCS-151]|uniref:hypothetical protein n=1 Tax=Nanhaiella sioensis TaxID=3115293 RepID=UPI00397B5817
MIPQADSLKVVEILLEEIKIKTKSEAVLKTQLEQLFIENDKLKKRLDSISNTSERDSK